MHFELSLLAGRVPTARRVLRWPYCHDLRELGLPVGQVPPLLELLAAADALAMEDLVRACEAALGELLSPFTAAAVFFSARAVQGAAGLALAACRFCLSRFLDLAALVPREESLQLLEGCLDYLTQLKVK